MNLVEIAKGWYHFINATLSHQQMMQFRLSICDGCESKKQLSPMGQAVLLSINQAASTFYCGECKCPLAGKTASPSSKCPLGKWNNIEL